jgi:hypothetical protein
MAVVTHGSFDEGPVVLALPSVYEFAAAEETDPIFTAWDKSTGISISQSQITDLSDVITTETLNTTLGGYVNDSELSSRIDAVYNDIDSYLTNYVPYVDATGNVDLGTHTVDAERIYVNQGTPISSTELATKGYVDNLAFTGAGGISPTVVHNDTTGKEGGGGGHWYHLSAVGQSVIAPIVDQTAIATPSGIYVISKGISIVNGHQSAYIELGWTANIENNFHHYVVFYKRTGYEVWAEILVSNNNQVLISGLIPGVQYDFAVSAVNASGNMTDMSTIFIAWMDSDTEGPATVAGVVATGAIQAILLRWTHNTDPDLVSYNIYRNTVNNSATAVKVANYQGNAFMDNGPIIGGTIGLTINTEYFYWLKAVDSSNNESSTFSTVTSATTRNIIASDIVNIAASQVIIQGLTTIASLFSPGVTTIDGNKITTGTVTLTKLNFTPALSNTIVASLNASPEGLQIDANLFKVSGTSVFAPKQSSEDPLVLSRVYFYPNATTAMRVTDDLGRDVFNIMIGGPNVGDITIGNYAGGQGIWYDKSAGVTHFAGRIEATSGSISGVLDFGTLGVSTFGNFENLALHGSDIWENTANTDGSGVRINRYGYNGTATKYRNFYVYDGKTNPILTVSGSTGVVRIDGELTINTTTGSLHIPKMTTTQRLNLIRSEDMIVYDIDLHRFCGVIQTGGILQWWTFGMSAEVN